MAKKKAVTKKKPAKKKIKKPLSVVELLKSYNGAVPDMWHEMGSPVSGVDKWNSVVEPSKSQLQSLVQESTSFACARWIANIIASTPLRLLITRESNDSNFQTPLNKRKALHPRTHKYLNETHKQVKSASVVEFSCVNIPANYSALVERKQKGLMSSAFEKVLNLVEPAIQPQPPEPIRPTLIQVVVPAPAKKPRLIRKAKKSADELYLEELEKLDSQLIIEKALSNLKNRYRA